MKKLLTTLILVALTGTPSLAVPLTDDALAFADRLHTKYGIDPLKTVLLIQNAEYSDKALSLMDRQFEKSGWGIYKKGIVTDNRSNKGGRFYLEHRPSLELAYMQYGVTPEIIAAILAVETNYGDYKLPHRAVDVLSTLGFHYPRRADYFRSELEALIVHTEKSGIDPLSVKSSYAGAVGIPQFMPSNINKFGVDFGGDNLIDLVNSRTDAIGSVGNYLAKFGWQKDKPTAIKLSGAGFDSFLGQGYDPKFTVKELEDGGIIFALPADPEEKVNVIRLRTDKGFEHWAIFSNFRTIMRYNNSANYALAVLLISKNIEEERKRLEAENR
ncbi:lytic murein transglycosylase [Geovibrio thiophilus]|uniref:Lytic murein transglycosylase n=1 Tax=Geovibrio thiophilus TaxID=139438 RepID=A0A410K1R5_9BACT|nr:lytic murein transglycosylase [Geovibrio thiophilus]QAR34377.1 lytic murein transglycosylase [Geovibrio thiophilus]